MTIQQQIEKEFTTLAQLNKSRAAELIETIGDMEPQQALARLQIEIQIESEQQVQTSNYDSTRKTGLRSYRIINGSKQTNGE